MSKGVAGLEYINNCLVSGRREQLLYERHLILLITALFAKDVTIINITNSYYIKDGGKSTMNFIIKKNKWT